MLSAGALQVTAACVARIDGSFYTPIDSRRSWQIPDASSVHANIPRHRIGGETHMTKSPRASAWRFTYVALRNWRNFTNMATTLPQRVFLVEPNASGKSNLLDALRFCVTLWVLGVVYKKPYGDVVG